jgi:hypothetical protein
MESDRTRYRLKVILLLLSPPSQQPSFVLLSQFLHKLTNLKKDEKYWRKTSLDSKLLKKNLFKYSSKKRETQKKKKDKRDQMKEQENPKQKA